MTEASEQRVYQTGGGGKRQARALTIMVAVYLLVIAAAWAAYEYMGVPRTDGVFRWMWPLFLIAAAGLAWALSCSMRESNSRATIDDDGLTVTDWLGRSKTYAWDDIYAVVWVHHGARLAEDHFSLSIHAEDEHGYVLPVDVGYNHYELDDELIALRDTIVEKKGFEKARGVEPGFWEKAANLFSSPLEYDLWK